MRRYALAATSIALKILHPGDSHHHRLPQPRPALAAPAGKTDRAPGRPARPRPASASRLPADRHPAVNLAELVHEFLDRRGLRRPDGHPLYAYRCSDAELDALRQVLAGDEGLH